MRAASMQAKGRSHSRRVREHITATMRGHEQEVCGLKWSPSGAQLASGGNDNLLHIWDAAGAQPVQRLTAHCAAVKALAWCPFQARARAPTRRLLLCLGGLSVRPPRLRERRLSLNHQGCLFCPDGPPRPWQPPERLPACPHLFCAQARRTARKRPAADAAGRPRRAGQPAGLGRRHGRPLHQVLEHAHRRAAQLHRHQLPGARPACPAGLCG